MIYCVNTIKITFGYPPTRNRKLNIINTTAFISTESFRWKFYPLMNSKYYVHYGKVLCINNQEPFTTNAIFREFHVQKTQWKFICAFRTGNQRACNFKFIETQLSSSINVKHMYVHFTKVSVKTYFILWTYFLPLSQDKRR